MPHFKMMTAKSKELASSWCISNGMAYTMAVTQGNVRICNSRWQLNLKSKVHSCVHFHCTNRQTVVIAVLGDRHFDHISYMFPILYSAMSTGDAPWISYRIPHSENSFRFITRIALCMNFPQKRIGICN